MPSLCAVFLLRRGGVNKKIYKMQSLITYIVIKQLSVHILNAVETYFLIVYVVY